MLAVSGHAYKSKRIERIPFSVPCMKTFNTLHACKVWHPYATIKFFSIFVEAALESFFIFTRWSSRTPFRFQVLQLSSSTVDIPTMVNISVSQGCRSLHIHELMQRRVRYRVSWILS